MQVTCKRGDVVKPTMLQWQIVAFRGIISYASGQLPGH